MNLQQINLESLHKRFFQNSRITRVAKFIQRFHQNESSPDLEDLLRNHAEEPEVVPEFVRTYVEQQVGGQLTVTEAALACRAICKTKGVALGSENRLRHEIKKAIRRYFDVGESHDLILAGRKSQRGFHGLVLRMSEVDSASTPSSVAGNVEPGVEEAPQADS